MINESVAAENKINDSEIAQKNETNEDETNENITKENSANEEIIITNDNQNEAENTSKAQNAIPDNSNFKDKNIKLVKTASPSGFAGSSLHEVRLYSDGSVYLITYDGEGFNDSNIGSNELIATNAEDIQGIPYKEGYENSKNIEAGTVIIKGKNLNVIDDGYGWMRFEK